MSSLFLEKLELKNFRNLKDISLRFSDKLNVVLGKNGQGKTNLLEAIFFVNQMCSFKSKVNFQQIVNIDANYFEIFFMGLFKDNDNFYNQSRGRINHSGAKWLWNDQKRNLKNIIPTVFLSPQNSYEFFLKKVIRRGWLDFHLSQLDLQYRKSLKAYNKLLKQRNNLLKINSINSKLYIALDIELSHLIVEIVKKRISFCKELKPLFTKVFSYFFNLEINLELEYISSLAGVKNSIIYDMLQSNIAEDLKHKVTRIGPHRDDISLHFNFLDLKEFGSLGQQKSAYFSLVFAYVELFRYKFNFYPMVLLDDISGELDNDRWLGLIRYLQNGQFQSFVTTANEAFGMNLRNMEKSKFFKMDSGKVFNL